MPLIERQGITLLGLSLGNLEDQDAVQLVLPLERRPAQALDAAVDGVRERFGKEAITRAVLIGRDRGWQPPMLPD
jgi:DNA polymerase-4